MLVSLSGCAALTIPVAAIPVDRVPPEYLGTPKSEQQMIDLGLLRQPPPDVYRLGPGDILGVWIEGVLGNPGEVPPISYEGGELPALGYPVPVREDGTVYVPMVEPLKVEGLSVEDVRKLLVRTYVEEKQILRKEHARIMVTLMRRRTYKVVVLRQEGTQLMTVPAGAYRSGRNVFATWGTQGISPPTELGAGYEVELPAYENDVLHALAQTGGLPGIGAANEIVIYRGLFARKRTIEGVKEQIKRLQQAEQEGRERMAQTIHIPLRLGPGQEPQFSPEDIILSDGDVVLIRSEPQFFFTAGLLPTGMYPLPRDYDLDVIQAISLVGGTLFNGGFSGYGNLQGVVIAGGLGDISPSKLLVLRRLPDGRQLPIYVDLNLALENPRYRILVQPGDILLLQQTPGEAVARYITRVLNFTAFWQIWLRQDSTGDASLVMP